MTTRNFAINDGDLKYRQLANLIAQLRGDAAQTLTRNVLKDGFSEKYKHMPNEVSMDLFDKFTACNVHKIERQLTKT